MSLATTQKLKPIMTMVVSRTLKVAVNAMEPNINIVMAIALNLMTAETWTAPRPKPVRRGGRKCGLHHLEVGIADKRAKNKQEQLEGRDLF